MKPLIFRLSNTEIAIDHELFIVNRFGIYEAAREELRDVNIFRSYIDAFLKKEEKARKISFERELTKILLDCKINCLGHYSNN